jgi:inorganic phosphate transporter, PiT family
MPFTGLDALSLFLCGLLAMVVAGNNLSAVSGTIIGTGIVRKRTGIIIAVIGYLIGLAIEGPRLFSVRQIFLPQETALDVLSILIATLIVFTVGEISKVPISLSKALTGAMIGTSISVGVFIYKSYLTLVLAFWFLTPVVATLLGVVLIRLDDRFSPKNTWKKLEVLRGGLLIAAFLSAYVLGSNTLGLIAGVPNNQSMAASLVVGLGSVIGAFTLGRGTLRRLTEGMFTLRYPNAFYSQLVGAGAVELASQFGVPLAITETVSSGIIGSGLGRKMRFMNTRSVVVIVISWVMSPLIGFAAGYILRSLL